MFQNFKTRLSQQLPETRAVAAPASPNQNPSPNAARRSEGRDADKEKEKDVSQGEYEVLQKQLARYKQRLGDVVQAYKTLQKEKQALEQSLQALSNAETGTTSTSAADGTTAAAAAVATAAAGEETQALQRRIAQLGEAVATLTKEKAGMGVHFTLTRCGYCADTGRIHPGTHFAGPPLHGAQLWRARTWTRSGGCSSSTRTLCRSATATPLNSRYACYVDTYAFAGRDPWPLHVASALTESKNARQQDVTERLVTAQAEAEAPRAEEGTEALRRALDDERSRVQRLDRDLAAIEAAWAQRLANRDAEVARLQAEVCVCALPLTRESWCMLAHSNDNSSLARTHSSTPDSTRLRMSACKFSCSYLAAGFGGAFHSMQLEDMTELHGELESRRESAEQRASRDEQELQGLRMEIEGLRRAKAEAESQLVALGSPVTSRRTSAQTHAATHAATPERKTSASAATTAPAPAPAASPLAATEPHAPAADTGAPDAAVTADAAAAADGADIDEEAVERRAEELALERVRVHEARVAASEAKCAQLQSMCDTLRHDMRAMKHEHQAQLSMS